MWQLRALIVEQRTELIITLFFKSTHTELFWKIIVLRSITTFSRKWLPMSLFKSCRDAVCYFPSYVPRRGCFIGIFGDVLDK